MLFLQFDFLLIYFLQQCTSRKIWIRLDIKIKKGWKKKTPITKQLMPSFEVNIRICQPSKLMFTEAITFSGWQIQMLTLKECINCIVNNSNLPIKSDTNMVFAVHLYRTQQRNLKIKFIKVSHRSTQDSISNIFHATPQAISLDTIIQRRKALKFPEALVVCAVTPVLVIEKLWEIQAVGKKRRMIVFQVRLFSLYFLDVSYVTYTNNNKVTEVALQDIVSKRHVQTRATLTLIMTQV